PVTPGGQDRPSGSKASTAQPSSRQLISPARTGTSGAVPRKAPHTSVPPLIDETGTPSASCTQRAPSAGSGAPVEPTQRRPAGRAGRRPALRHAIRNGADTPKTVEPVSAARSQSVAGPWWLGSPSKTMTAAPVSSPDISRFHIIQPV